jgi:hypothetical protein
MTQHTPQTAGNEVTKEFNINFRIEYSLMNPLRIVEIEKIIVMLCHIAASIFNEMQCYKKQTQERITMKL